MKRIFLFLATNLAVILVMSIVLSLLGVNRYLYGTGLNLGNLLVFSLVVGFTGSIISLFDQQADGEMVNWCTRHYDTCEFDGKLASLNGRQIVP